MNRSVRSLVAVLILLCAVPSARAQQTYVVSVGIADYKEINDLRLTENDVAVFNQLMSYQGAKITTLTGNAATHTAIVAALRGAFARAKAEDTMIFFFSGHGYEGGFCCYDMAASPPSTADGGVTGGMKREQLNSTYKSYGGLSYDEMQILFRNCRAGKKLVFADACFSGGLQKGEQLGLSVQSARNGDVVYFLSSQTDETSLEMAGGTNGLFTYYLAKGLAGEADANTDRSIQLQEIFDYVYRGVTAYAARIPHNQHPVLWGRFDKTMTVFKLK